MIIEVHPYKMYKLRTRVSGLYLKLLNKGFTVYRIDYGRGLICVRHQKPSLEILRMRHHILAVKGFDNEVAELQKIMLRPEKHYRSITDPRCFDLRHKTCVWLDRMLKMLKMW